MKKHTPTLAISFIVSLLLLAMSSQFVHAQMTSSQIRDYFNYSDNEAYRWLCSIAHPTNVFSSGSCNVSGNNVTVTINSKNFISSSKYTLTVRLHRNGSYFDSIEIVDDTDWVPPFTATDLVKELALHFWREFSPKTTSKIENLFGSLSNISSKRMCLAILTGIYWRFQSSSSTSYNYNSSNYPLSFNMHGRIGDNLEATCYMSFNQRTDKGTFSYDLKGNDINRTLKLVSFDFSTNTLVLKEYTIKGKVVGLFSGTYKNGCYTGYFTNLNKGVSIPFSLRNL